MQCEQCGERPATVHQTVITNGQKQESHLCQVCAQSTGAFAMSPPGFSFPNLSIQELLASFLGGQPMSMSTAVRPQAEPRCSHCGLAYSQFAESGRLGCSHCYDELEPHLVPLIRRIHGTTTHAGKVPKRTGGMARKQREQIMLNQQLQTAIQHEQYEEAARIRDQLRRMEGQFQAGGDDHVVE
jgi:protein arginine kinase activator